MATINFLYRSIRESAPITVRLLYRHKGKDYVHGAKTKLLVSKNYWNEQHKLKRPKDISVLNQQTEINNELNNIKNFLLTEFNDANTDHIEKNWLRDKLKAYYSPKAKSKELPKELIPYFDVYLNFKENELRSSTIKKCNVIKNLLLRYESFIGRRLKIVDIDSQFKREFEIYCEEEGYATNTISVTFKFIKTVCNHAGSKGVEISPELKLVRKKPEKVEKIYLNFDELERIESISNSRLNENLQHSRDWLIISSYTGQRISDFMCFSKEQIRVEKGKSLIEFRQKKTDKLMTIPLHQKVLKILEKRDGDFPKVIVDQKYNYFIKEVCRIAGINKIVTGSKKIEIPHNSGKFRKIKDEYQKWELVTSHIGRRSFATNFYGQIPTTYLTYVTGHSTESMFLNYIGKSNKDLALELTNYF